MTRICVDLTVFATGSRFRGIGRYAAALGEALARTQLPAGLELKLLFPRRGARGARLIDPGELEAALPAYLDRSSLVLPYGIYYAWKRALLPRLLERHGVSLFHSTDPKGTPRTSCRTIVTCHDLIPTMIGYPYRPKRYPRAASLFIERWRYLRHDHVIAITEWTRQDLKRIIAIPDEQVSVVHLGVDRALFGDAPELEAARMERLTRGRPFFLYVGGFDPRKRVETMIRAFARCRGEIEENLALCGRRNEYARPLDRLVAELGAEDRVLFLEFVSDDELRALYRAATAHVMISTYEGFGLTIGEAFASGCPVIAARATCTPEVAGGAALLVGPDDVAATADAMIRVARDEQLRAALSRRGRTRAEQLSWTRCAERTLEVYRRTLDGPRRGRRFPLFPSP